MSSPVSSASVAEGARPTGYNSYPLRGQSRTAPEWLGPLEHRILSRLFETGLRVFRPMDLGLDVDRRRLWDALQRLVKRGILEKVSRGVYRVKASLEKLLALPTRRLNNTTWRGSVKDTPSNGQGTRVSSRGFGVGFDVVGPFFDNVRGFTVSGFYVGGDRGRVLSLGELVGFVRVSYGEVLYRVGGLFLPGQLVVYTNVGQDGGGVRVEWRPPRGFVKRNGLGSAVRMFWEAVLTGARALVRLLLAEAPWDVRRRFYRFLREAGVCMLVCV